MLADYSQHNLSGCGGGVRRVRAVGAVRRARVGGAGRARRAVRAGGLGRRAAGRRAAGAGRRCALLSLAAGGRLRSASPQRRGERRGGVVGRGARGRAACRPARAAVGHGARAVRAGRRAHATHGHHPAGLAVLRCGGARRLAALVLGGARQPARPLRLRAARLLQRTRLLLRGASVGGVRGGAARARGRRCARGPARARLRRARAGRAAAHGARATGGRRRAAGGAGAGAAAHAGALPARAAAPAAVQGLETYHCRRPPPLYTLTDVSRGCTARPRVSRDPRRPVAQP